MVPDADRPIAWILAVLGGAMTLLGGVPIVLTLLGKGWHGGGGEGEMMVLFLGVIAVAFGGPWLAGSIRILRGHRDGYAGYLVTALVAVLGTVWTMRGNLVATGLLPLMIALGPAALAGRRLSSGGTIPQTRPSAPGDPNATIRTIGLGATALGALLLVRGSIGLMFGRIGPPVPMDGGDRFRTFVYGGGGGAVAGLVLLAGGVLALFGVRAGLVLALVGLVLAVAPYSLAAGPVGALVFGGAALAGGVLLVRAIRA